MLTLQELKQVVSNREERRKVPSAKYLRENEVAVAKQRLMDCAEIIAYQTGYVLYCVGDYATVFPLFTCRDYVYEAERKIAVVEENFFDDQPWYVRLILEGEDRLWRNRETREHNNCVSYSCISEEWCELADKGQCLLEKIIAEETVRELMDLLTERQRQMIQRIYFQQKTQKEVSHELGITVPAVSKCISQGKSLLQILYNTLIRAQSIVLFQLLCAVIQHPVLDFFCKLILGLSPEYNGDIPGIRLMKHT